MNYQVYHYIKIYLRTKEITLRNHKDEKCRVIFMNIISESKYKMWNSNLNIIDKFEK